MGFEAAGFAEFDDMARGMLRVLMGKLTRECQLKKIAGREGCRVGDGVRVEGDYKAGGVRVEEI